MESPSVRKKIGNHIADYVNNPEPELREAISKCKQTGITRAEITYYLVGREHPIGKDYFTNEMDTHLKYLENSNVLF